MRRFIVVLIALVIVAGFGFWAATKDNHWTATKDTQKIKREPLQKPGFILKSPTVYAKGEREKGGRVVNYDVKPRVELVDARRGKYEFRWIGYDGQEKVIAYQSPDAVDAVFAGSVERSLDGTYVYNYALNILPSSGTYVAFFILQNFADDTRPIEVNGKPANLADVRLLASFRQVADDGKPRNLGDLLIGEMSSQIFRFKDGKWISFGISPELGGAGRRLQVKMVSKATPGLVGCSVAGGPRTMKGVGEEMPSELADLIPGYEALPSGYTVGPVATLNSLSQSQRVNYLLDKMVQFEKLGWITPAARRWYEKNLRNDVEAALIRAQKDLDSEQISSEVFAMIQAIK